MSNQSERDPQLQKFFRELHKAKDDERSLILLTNGFLELLISTLIEKKLKNGKEVNSNSNYTYSIKLLLVNEKELIDDELYKILDWFRKLRNRAAHKPFFNITDGDFGTIKDYSQKLSPINGIENPLLMLCIRLIAYIWNSHTDILLPEFNPQNG